MTVAYGEQRAQFRYGLRIDGVQQSAQQPIWLNVVTSTNAQDRADAIRMGMGMRDTITLLLDMSDKTLLDDLRMYVKTYTYLMRTDKNTQSEVRQQIISRKSIANERLYAELRTRVAKAAANGEFDYNGGKVEVKSTEVQARMAEGLGTLIGRYYTNFSLLGGQRYEETDLARIIMNASQHQPGMLDGMNAVQDKLDVPADDVFAAVSRDKGKGMVATVKSLLDAYGSVPYGWPYAATLACIGHLYGSDRITLTLDGKPVQRSEAARLLRETKKQDSIRVDLPRVFDTRKVSQLRDFARDFLGLTAADLPSNAIDLAEAVTARLKREAESLTQLRVRNAQFGFVQQLDAPIEKINYASGMSEDWLLGDFTAQETENGSEELLEFKEDVIDPIVAFLNGSQSRILADGLEWLKNNKPNIDYAFGTTASLYQSAEQLANDPNIFRKTNKFKTTIDDLREETDAAIRTERANALKDVEGIRAKIHDSAEYQHAAQAAQAEAETELDQVAERMQNMLFIYKMRESVHELSERTYPQLINRLSASAPRPKTAPAGEAQAPTAMTTDVNTPESRQEVTPRVAVSFATISRPHTKDALETKDDVDDFLDAYRRELIAAIENGKKILL